MERRVNLPAKQSRPVYPIQLLHVGLGSLRTGRIDTLPSSGHFIADPPNMGLTAKLIETRSAGGINVNGRLRISMKIVWRFAEIIEE